MSERTIKLNNILKELELCMDEQDAYPVDLYEIMNIMWEVDR